MERKRKRRKFRFYPINIRIDGTAYHQFEFYILPMLRYMDHGTNFKMIQFRWLVWGINIPIEIKKWRKN